jgi:hypothetical protein
VIVEQMNTLDRDEAFKSVSPLLEDPAGAIGALLEEPGAVVAGDAPRVHAGRLGDRPHLLIEHAPTGVVDPGHRTEHLGHTRSCSCARCFRDDARAIREASFKFIGKERATPKDRLVRRI